MENEPVEPPKQKTDPRAKWYLSGTLLLLFLGSIVFAFFLACGGIEFPLQIQIYTFVGWFLFLSQVIPQMTVSVSGILTTLLLIVLIIGIVQILGGYTFRRLQNKTSIEIPKEWRLRWTFALMVLLVFSFAGGFAIVGIAQQGARLVTGYDVLISRGNEVAKRSQTKNNLKQIGLALHNYHEIASQFPIGGTFKAGQPQHSWVSQLLPYLDQEALFHQIDFEQPWNAEVNRNSFETEIPTLQIPGMESVYDNGKSNEENARGYQPAHYAANGRILNVNSSMVIEDISDGVSNTLLAGEIKTSIKPWGDPRNFRDPALGINKSSHGFGGPFTGGTHFLFADGSVRFITEKIDPAVLNALSTPAGSETVGEF